MKIQSLLIAAALLLCSAAAFGQSGPPQATLDVEYGWGQWIRPGRWTPVKVVVSSQKPRNAILEVYAPQAGSNAMRVRQAFALGPTPTIFPLYVPLVQGSDTLSVVLSDAQSGKTLARYPESEEPTYLGGDRFMEANRRLIGISGQALPRPILEGNDGLARFASGYLPPELLPATPTGYDSVDLLLLNSPNLLGIDVAQQKAILDWVRGGGNLLLWPGDDPVPQRGPLIEALPCAIGGPIEIPLGPIAQDLQIGRAITGIRGRTLTPADKAEAISLLGTPLATAYARRLGLGRIVVVPTDLSQLRFGSPDNLHAIWRPVLAGTGTLNDEQAGDTNQNSYNRGDPDLSRESAAVSNIQNNLADVPGAGRFGFSYVATVLLAMMVIVGPLDWFVLKRLGRQPWTWATTSGWIALVTLGALYAGHFFKSGDLHYRSVTLIDQAGDATIGRASVTCIYSPRTTDYHLDAPGTPAPDPAATGAEPPADPPPGWWEPSSAQNEYYYSSYGPKNDIPFRQTQEGNEPGALLINVWNMRFLRSRSGEPGAAMVRADLSITYQNGGRPTVAGTVMNLTDRPLTNIRIGTGEGFCRFLPAEPGAPRARPEAFALPRIEPGATITINGTVTDLIERSTDDQAEIAMARRVRGMSPLALGPPRVDEGADLWQATSGLDGTRSRRIEDLVERHGFAAIYAELPSAPPPAALREQGAIERHFALLRAVVPLAGARPATRPTNAPTPANPANAIPQVDPAPAAAAPDGE